MKKVLLLFGGNSSEHKVSCLSAKSVLENIDSKKFKITSVGIDLKNEWYIFNDDFYYLEKGTWKQAKNIRKIPDIVSFIKSFDVVFPIIHGTNGEDGKLQGFLDLFNIKYVGCGTLSSAVGMDKEFAKIIFNYMNIPQVKYISIKYPNFKIKDIEKQLSYPLIVKPANGGSSIGISKAANRKQLLKAIKLARKYDEKIIVENFIKARELECSAIEGKGIFISTIGEIKSANDFYDYDAKYENASSKTVIPAVLPNEVSSLIKEYAKKAFIGINAKGIARIDFFYDQDNNQIYLNEINTMPGFTTISMYPKLLIFDGINYKDILTILINNA
jgi:D-alanine-D-alanine ligase